MSDLVGYIGSVEDVNSLADLFRYGWVVLVYPMLRDRLGGLSKLLPKRRDADALARLETKIDRMEALLLSGASTEHINLDK